MAQLFIHVHLFSNLLSTYSTYTDKHTHTTDFRLSDTVFGYKGAHTHLQNQSALLQN